MYASPGGSHLRAYMQRDGGIYYWVRDYAFKNLMPRVRFPSFRHQLSGGPGGDSFRGPDELIRARRCHHHVNETCGNQTVCFSEKKVADENMNMHLRGLINNLSYYSA